ncbi:MAG: right-handed parallel beta-helix repeat-containing protein [Promethearchaeota archaeon]
MTSNLPGGDHCEVGTNLQQTTVIADYTPHDPIQINSDDDFVTLGFPGSGTIEDPYIIRDLEIYTSVQYEHSISIAGIDSFFEISNCNISADFGIWIENSRNFVIANNEIRQMYYFGQYYGGLRGISIEMSSGFTVLYNTVGYVTEYESFNMGILISDSSNGTIESNTVSGAYMGIEVGGTDMTITDNIVRGKGEDEAGILSHASYSRVIGNNCTEYINGIALWGGTGNQVTNNYCYGNSIGIDVSGSHQNVISNNSCYENAHWAGGVTARISVGIKVESDSSYNIISMNKIEHNLGYGVSFIGIGLPVRKFPEYNQVFLNIFDDNNVGSGRQAYDEGGGNGFGYNYWSDWVDHPDNNEDGIIDSPYPIEGGFLVDPYPLANSSLAYSLDINSVPTPHPIIRFVQGNVLLISLGIIVIVVLIVIRRRK